MPYTHTQFVLKMLNYKYCKGFELKEKKLGSYKKKIRFGGEIYYVNEAYHDENSFWQ